MPLDETWEPIDTHVLITEAGPIPLNIRRVQSSNISWVGWPQAAEAAPMMVVQFVDGSRYIYFGVSRQRANAVARAKSSGEYLNRKIKNQGYRVLKVR